MQQQQQQTKKQNRQTGFRGSNYEAKKKFNINTRFVYRVFVYLSIWP